MLRRLALLCCLLSLASEARAQTVTDERVWAGLVLQESGAAGSPWRWTLEAFLRTRDGIESLDVYSVRPTILYALTPRSTVGVGYAFGASFPASGGTTIEHRVYGQYQWIGRAAGGTLSFRTRFDTRFIENNSGTSIRIRQQARFSHAVRPGSRLSVVAYDELLVHVNDTTRNPRGVDQNRAFLGLGTALRPSARIEAGYLNQFSPGHRGAADRMNHILSGTAVVSF